MILLHVKVSHSVVSDSLQPHGLCSPGNFPGQNTGMGSLSLLQRIFPTQGSNPGLPALQADSLPAELQGILEWVAYPFPRGSSRARNLIGVSCIAGRFLINWAMIMYNRNNMFAFFTYKVPSEKLLKMSVKTWFKKFHYWDNSLNKKNFISTIFYSKSSS